MINDNNYYIKNKKKYDRVTHILKIVADPDFDKFRAAVSPDRFNSIMENARDRGTNFHLLIEKYANKEVTPAVIKGLEIGQPDLVQPFKTFISWADANVVQFLMVEKTVYHEKLLYAGTPDFVAIVKGKKAAVLFDLKFTAKLSPLAALQTAAYVEAANLEMKNKIGSREVLRFNKAGKMIHHKMKSQATDFIRFLHAQDLFKYMQGGRNE